MNINVTVKKQLSLRLITRCLFIDVYVFHFVWWFVTYMKIPHGLPALVFNQSSQRRLSVQLVPSNLHVNNFSYRKLCPEFLMPKDCRQLTQRCIALSSCSCRCKDFRMAEWLQTVCNITGLFHGGWGLSTHLRRHMLTGFICNSILIR